MICAPEYISSNTIKINNTSKQDSASQHLVSKSDFHGDLRLVIHITENYVSASQE
jgi:hypothetical protein